MLNKIVIRIGSAYYIDTLPNEQLVTSKHLTPLVRIFRSQADAEARLRSIASIISRKGLNTIYKRTNVVIIAAENLRWYSTYRREVFCQLPTDPAPTVGIMEN